MEHSPTEQRVSGKRIRESLEALDELFAILDDVPADVGSRNR